MNSIPMLDSDNVYQQIFNLTHEAIFIVENGTGNIVATNRTARLVYGYSEEEFLSMQSSCLSAEPEKSIEQGHKITDAKLARVPLRQHKKKTGEVFPVEVTAKSIFYNAIPAHILMIRDITVRQQIEARRICRETQLIDVLRTIADSLVKNDMPLNEFYAVVLREFSSILPSDKFHINIIDKARNEVYVPFDTDASSKIPQRRPVGRGITEYVIRRNRPMIISPPTLAELIIAGEIDAKYPDAIGATYYMCAPLTIASGEPFGGIALLSYDDFQPFFAEDLDIFSLLASEISMAILHKDPSVYLSSDSKCSAIWVLDETGNHIEDVSLEPYIVTNYVINRTREDNEKIKAAYRNHRIGVTESGVAIVLVPGNWEHKINPAGQIKLIRQNILNQQ